MTNWTDDQLERVADAVELKIAPLRRNGELRCSTPIWVVRAGDDLYVRAAYVPGSGWYDVALASGRAHVSAGGVETDVAVEQADESVFDAVDAAYRNKYGNYASIVDKITDAEHRATTLRLIPQADA